MVEWLSHPTSYNTTVPTVYAIDFTLGGDIAEDQRERSVECEVGLGDKTIMIIILTITM